MADAFRSKEAQDLHCQLLPAAAEPALVSDWRLYTQLVSPCVRSHGIFQSQDRQGESYKQQDGKEATHSLIVASKSWSQVKEASENCTTLSVEKKTPP